MHYALFRRALGELYTPDVLALKAAEKPDFNHKRFQAAARYVYNRGGFSPEMLRSEPVRAVIDETNRVLGSALSVTHETPPELTAALRNNVFIFSGLKTYHSLSEVGLSLTNEDGSTKSWADFHDSVKAIDGQYNTNYLYAEYNHAVHSSQMAVKWHEWEKDGDRYDLQYRTAGDERVREAHRQLDGVTLPPSDKFWERYLPPNGWNCRCNVVQVLRDDYPRSDSDKATAIGDEYTQTPKAQMFRFNAGKTLEIFPAKHPYNKAPKRVKEVIETLPKPSDQFIAQTIAEAEDNFRSLGLNCRLDGFKKKDLAQVKDIYECVQRHLQRYPELKSEISFVGSMTGRINFLTEAIYNKYVKLGFAPTEGLKRTAKAKARQIAYCKNCYAYSHGAAEEYGANGLVFNTAWAGEKIVNSLAQDVASKFHPVSCDSVKSVFDHELGHKMDALLKLRTDADLLSLFNSTVAQGSQYMIDNLSKYAGTSCSEFIAEAWSEYLNNPNPRELATKVGRLIEKKYNEK